MHITKVTSTETAARQRRHQQQHTAEKHSRVGKPGAVRWKGDTMDVSRTIGLVPVAVALITPRPQIGTDVRVAEERSKNPSLPTESSAAVSLFACRSSRPRRGTARPSAGRGAQSAGGCGERSTSLNCALPNVRL